MFITYHNVMSGDKYREWNIIKLTECKIHFFPLIIKFDTNIFKFL